MRRAAFTLVELLIVIVITAVLIGILSGAFIQARNHAKRGRAMTQLRELTKAWAVYYQTYTNWPTANPALDGRDDVPMTYANLQPLFATLDDAGLVNPNNKNAIPFLSIKIEAGETYCDPWGNPYKISFKSRNDQQVVALAISVNFPNRDRYR